MLANTSPVV